MKSSPVEQVEGERSLDKEYERSDEAKMVGEVDVDEISAVARAHEVSRMSKPLALSKDLQITAAMLASERQQEEGCQSVPVQQNQSLKDVTPLPQPMPLSESDDLPSLAIVSGVEKSHPELRMMSKNAALRQDLQLSPAEMMTRNTRDLDKRRPVHSYQSLKDIIPLPQPMPLETRARSPPPTLPAEVSPGAYNIVGVRPIGAYHFSRPTAPPTRTSSAPEPAQNHEGLVEATQVQDHLPTGHAVLENAKTRPPSPPKRLLGYSMLASMVLAVVLLALIVTLATDNYAQNQEMKRVASSHHNNGTIANNGNATSSSNYTLSPAWILTNLPDFTLSSLQDPFSPQTRAYQWLEQHPNITNLPQWRRRQLFALVTFYYAFDGPSWPLGIDTDWLDTTRSECDWYSNYFGQFIDEANFAFQYHDSRRSICNDKGEYIVIHLAAAANVGFQVANAAVPPELSFLTSLRHFIWRNNGITNVSSPYILPTVIYQQMTNLEHISIGFNSWNKNLPSELGLLTKLSILRFPNSALHGSIPSELGLLTALRFLEIESNALTGSIPTELERLTSLQWLRLNDNRLTGQVPSNLSSSTLRVLHLQNNSLLSGTIPGQFCWLEGGEADCKTFNPNGKEKKCSLKVDCTERLCGCDCACHQ